MAYMRTPRGRQQLLPTTVVNSVSAKYFLHTSLNCGCEMSFLTANARLARTYIRFRAVLTSARTVNRNYTATIKTARPARRFSTTPEVISPSSSPISKTNRKSGTVAAETSAAQGKSLLQVRLYFVAREISPSIAIRRKQQGKKHGKPLRIYVLQKIIKSSKGYGH